MMELEALNSQEDLAISCGFDSEMGRGKLNLPCSQDFFLSPPNSLTGGSLY